MQATPLGAGLLINKEPLMWKKILAVLAMLYAVAAFAAVDVNTASAAELDGIKGIGPATSTRIVDERKKGQFKDWQDFIDRVKGVGEGNAAKFSAEGLTVNGDSFKGAAATKKEAKKESKATAKAEKKAEKAEKAEKKEEKKEDKKEAKADAAKPAASAKAAASSTKAASAKK
jgi:competence protein ComEA